MPRATNYNYAFVFYDVNEKRVNKVFKICKKYFKHHQKSVFRGNISPANLIKLRAEIKKIINEREDFVSIIKLMSENSFHEETLGINANNSESLII
ncbi:CRISPR-associated endonuclease Cas2 [Clostridium sp.]|jgi:CRISPR-associated protein Cas2|uniref:CRISPR-associated endonuclease Cas2 n=1 Tax=Clostridium sp. TaxID=1506 RepID=UPI002583BED4|nr:CRISPR-associated endonuclease Cas2 [Clostridium sp.]MDF2506123.1 cas2 [Clostridium sp.]